MKRTTLVALAGLTLACSAHAASFGCGKAQTRVEKLIYSDVELSSLDEALAMAYSAARRLNDNPMAVQQAQKRWLTGDVTLTLAEGQTEVAFAVIETGSLTTNSALTLSASYTSAGQTVSSSNTAQISLVDSGEPTHTFIGDQRGKLIGTETQPTVTAGNPAFETYDWGTTSWTADGSLTSGKPEADFNDVIYGNNEADKINGKGGNDALDGGVGNDQIDGGDGDDLIGGGAGNLGGDLRGVHLTPSTTKKSKRYRNNSCMHTVNEGYSHISCESPSATRAMNRHGERVAPISHHRSRRHTHTTL